MHHDKHHILWPEGEHPSLALLRQYQQGDLPPALHHQLERHLLGCELCADVLEGMALSEAEQTKAAVTDINRSIKTKVEQGKKKPDPVFWQAAAAVLVLLASAVLVIYYNYREQQPAQELATVGAVVKPAEAPLLDLSPPAAATAPDTPGTAETPAASRAAITQVETYAPPVVKRDKEQVPAQEAIAEGEIVCDVLVEDIQKFAEETPPDRSFLAGIDDAVESTPVPFDSSNASLLKEEAATMALAPEPVNAGKALAGKTKGITIRGFSSLKAAATAADQKQVSGQVLSPEGEPLPGVVVLSKGTPAATLTDADGRYTLAVPEQEQTLLFSYIGYETAEKVLAKNDTAATISLSPDKLALSEVVVTAYGVAEPAPAATPAHPTVGRRKYKKYLQESSREVPEQGKVIIAFTVGTDGKPQQLRVVKGLCPACDAEAQRLIQEGPRWKPATQDGQLVAKEVRVTVRFK